MLLTPEELAARLQINVRTVERWQSEGILPFLRLGSKVRFHWPTVVTHLTTNFTVCNFQSYTHPPTWTFGETSRPDDPAQQGRDA